MPTFAETIAYIKLAHDEQVTKSGEPYWTHPAAVERLLPSWVSDDARHAALLHDVIEDCGVTPDDLRLLGYSDRVIELVQRLSRPKGADRPTYMTWIRSIGQSGDRELIAIKLADNEHNSDPERIAALPEAERGIADRYERSMTLLRAALDTIEKSSNPA